MQAGCLPAHLFTLLSATLLSNMICKHSSGCFSSKEFMSSVEKRTTRWYCISTIYILFIQFLCQKNGGDNLILQVSAFNLHQKRAVAELIRCALLRFPSLVCDCSSLIIYQRDSLDRIRLDSVVRSFLELVSPLYYHEWKGPNQNGRSSGIWGLSWGYTLQNMDVVWGVLYDRGSGSMTGGPRAYFNTNN